MKIQALAISTGWRMVLFGFLGSAILLTACTNTTLDAIEDCSGIACSVRDIEAQAGFAVIVPQFVPSYFAFETATFDSEDQSVILSYSHRDAPREYLLVSQRLAELVPTYRLEEFYPADAIRNVLVGSEPAEYIQGVYVSGEFNPSISNQQIVWRAQGMEFSIAATLPNNTAEEILIRIAQSMD